MSNDPDSKSIEGTDDEASEEPTGEKATVPPPAMYGTAVSEEDVEEATLLAKIPDELIESIRDGNEGDRPSVGGLKQMFSRDPTPIRHAVPSEAEGDALLDMLFEDRPAEPAEEVDDGVVTSAPALHGSRAAPVPPRPAIPPRPGKSGDAPHSPSELGVPAIPAPPRPPRAPRPGAASPRPAGPPRPVSRPEASPVAASPAPEAEGDSGDRATPIPDGGDGEESPFEFAPPSSDRLDSAANGDRVTAAEADASDQAVEAHPHERETPDEPAEIADDATEVGGPFLSAHDEAGEEARDLPPAALDQESEAVEIAPASTDEVAAEEAAAETFLAPLPSVPPPAASFEDEQDASAGLVQSQQRDAWAERAAWLRAEADAIEDKGDRARALLTVAELHVMIGEEATARDVAIEARELSPNLVVAHRLVRSLLLRLGEPAEALEALDAETRILGTPAARSHNALFGAEIARVALGDVEGAQKRLDVAFRVHPSDPRPHVQRFCDALAASASEAEPPPAVARFRLPDASELAPLAAACTQVAIHRHGVPRGRNAPATSYEALLRARTLLAGGDVVAGIGSLAHLRSTAIGAGAGWLLASLAAARPETRSTAVIALRGVIDNPNGTHADLARRALAARAIELGDADAARDATSTGGGAFTPADRVALAALTGGRRDDVDAWIDALVGDPDYAPLSAAASAALGDPTASGASSHDVHPAGILRARVGATLGRALARDATATQENLDSNEIFTRAVGAYADLAPDSPITRALQLELDVEAERSGKVAHAISSLREGDGERDGAIAGAILAELAGDTERAIADFERARLADLQHEGAARARAAHEGGAGAAKILAEHALALEQGPRASIILTEAAIRLIDAGDLEEAERFLARAAEIDPRLPIATHLGERSARSRADRDGLIEWLRTRREVVSDPLERAHDVVREALLVAESDPPSAAALLEQALAARPQDNGLRELFERLAPEPPADRATWRAERAAEVAGAESARLALEAALEFERTGDLAQAAACARQALAAGDGQLAPVVLYRAALAGHGAGEIIDALIPRAREASDTDERREIYERLADLDEQGRKDSASGLLWRRSILEETPNHLPTLRAVASVLIADGRDEELEPIALEIARALEGPEAIAHALLSARLRMRVLPWEETREPVLIAYRNEPRGIWALRQMAAHARVRGEHALAIEADRQLIERTDRPSEAAVLSARAARDALLAGSMEDAVAFFRHAITLVPSYLFAHLELASALEAGGEFAGAAEALEAAAAAAVTAEVKLPVLYRAAVLWQDKAADAARARSVFEAIAAIDPSHGDVFPRLQAIYIAEGARAELAALLERRLDAVTDPAERVEMEVLRGRALADVGDAAAAKSALAAALDANPDHVDALSAFAEVCAAEEDWEGAEQAWIRLARLVPDAAKQIAIYLRLGALYDEHLPNPERAELAYQEILKRAPSDVSARERLVGLYKRAGDGARAMEQQNVLIEAAETPEEKCRRTAELAEIFEAIGDTKKAETTLLQARKTWPRDGFAIGALARFYLRNDQAPAANVLLDRALADARRALNTGRFEPYLFATVATVAELRGKPGTALTARATVSALEGHDAALGGAGAGAADAALDELIAPDIMTAAFRELLLKTGSVLDSAVPFDLDSIRATPLPSPHAEIAESLGAAYGMPALKAYTTAALGAVCIPASTNPPAIVLGEALVASPREDVRLFLMHRALKILQTNGSAFSRTAPIDLAPLLSGYLKAFNPSWSPQGIDPARLTDAYGRVTRAMEGAPDPQLGILAADVIGTIGNRASTLNTVINGWGNRAALMALGDLNVAFTAIAWSGGHANAPPPQGKERITWIGRNAEARDLIVFAVSDAFSDARERLGLG